MLAIRLQRTGRSGHSQFRLIAQDSRFSPKRGRVVAYLGSYNPHTKEAKIDSEKVAQYLSNGAQPSDSAAKLLRKEGVKLPAWVSTAEPKKRSVRNPDKRRSTRPAEVETPAPPEPKTETEKAPVEPAGETQTEPAAAADPEAEESTAEAGDSSDTAQPEAIEEKTEPSAGQA